MTPVPPPKLYVVSGRRPKYPPGLKFNGRVVRRLARAAGFATQTDLAYSLSISPSMLSEALKGRRQPTWLPKALAAKLGCDLREGDAAKRSPEKDASDGGAQDRVSPGGRAHRVGSSRSPAHRQGRIRDDAGDERERSLQRCGSGSARTMCVRPLGFVPELSRSTRRRGP